MTYKLKSLFTLTCLSVALLGASLGVTKPVKAYGYGYDYSYGYGYPYPYYLNKGYEDGLREGSKLFTFTDSSKNNHYGYYDYGYGYGYKTGYSDGIARTRRNYPFLSLIGDTWNWAESWFR